LLYFYITSAKGKIHLNMLSVISYLESLKSFW